MHTPPPDETINAEAIPEEQPNAASPGPERHIPPPLGRLWTMLLVGIGVLLGAAFLWHALSGSN